MSSYFHATGGGSSDVKWAEIAGKPSIFNCMRIYGGTELDAAATTSDANAQYPIISKSTASTGALFTKTITDLPKGNYSVMVRMKISAVTSSANVFKITVTDGTVVTTKYIRPNMLSAANSYATLGFTVEHNSSSISIAMSVNSALSGATVGIDYLTIAPAFTAVAAIS